MPPDPDPPQRSRERALAQYRWRAARYDQELRPFEPIRREAVAALGLRPGETVIDLGCGTGLSFPLLLEAVGPRGRVIGVEQCPDMLAVARVRAEACGPGGIELVAQPAEEFHEAGLRADAALLHFTHDILRSPAALDALFAHLRPGARVVAAGLKWAPAWAWPTNLFVWAAALYSVTALDGLQSPWDRLAQRLDEVEVQPALFDGAYVARGVVPGGAPAAGAGEPVARRGGRRMAPVPSAPPKHPP